MQIQQKLDLEEVGMKYNEGKYYIGWDWPNDEV
jgi:hypothetical protein